ncbi:MAG: hypothetical protein ACKVQK_06340, partial [Burkholderiales bacterium]
MQSDCIECRRYADDGLPGANFPAAWVPLQSSDTVRIPSLSGNSHLRRCKACGTVWHIGWNPKDGVYEGIWKIPTGAQTVLQANASAMQVLRDGLANDGARSVASEWFENAPASAEEKIEALGRAIGGHFGMLDDAAIEHCLQWLERVTSRNPRAASVLADKPALLKLLATIPERTY